jgi:hypothetical protein
MRRSRGVSGFSGLPPEHRGQHPEMLIALTLRTRGSRAGSTAAHQRYFWSLVRQWVTRRVRRCTWDITDSRALVVLKLAPSSRNSPGG